MIKPAAKVPNWQAHTTYVIGDKVRTGTAVGEDWRRHYICTVGGKSAGGSGPRSLGNDKLLDYKAQTNSFPLEQYIVGRVSGASAIVIADANAGASGPLFARIV